MRKESAAGAARLSASHAHEKLSPWWRRASLLIMALGFAVLILLTVKVYHEAPPIPDKVTGHDGSVVSVFSIAIEDLLTIGYPAHKILWYRGGIQDWESLGLTTLTRIIHEHYETVRQAVVRLRGS